MESKTEYTKRLLLRAQNLCSRQEKCRSDIRSKLLQWGASPSEIIAIERKLIDEKFIDEQRYATNFAREKARFNKWGPRKIEMALRAKQIDTQNIRLAIAEAGDLMDHEALKEILRKKFKTLRYSSTTELRSKLIRFAVSRGFSIDAIETCLPSVTDETR